MRGRSKFLLLAFVVALHFSSIFPALADAGAWQSLAPDLERFSKDGGFFRFFSSEFFAVRTSLTRFNLQVVRAVDYGSQTSTAQEICRRSKASVCLNAGYFDEEARPLGLLMSRGKVLNQLHRGGATLTGIFQLARSGPAIITRAEGPSALALEAVQAGPRILHEGHIVRSVELAKSSRRTGVCIDQNGRLILYVALPGVGGYPLAEVAEQLQRIGCQEALNLDGGGSTQMFISEKLPGGIAKGAGRSVDGKDPVPVFLALVSQ